MTYTQAECIQVPARSWVARPISRRGLDSLTSLACSHDVRRDTGLRVSESTVTLLVLSRDPYLDGAPTRLCNHQKYHRR